MPIHGKGGLFPDGPDGKAAAEEAEKLGFLTIRTKKAATKKGKDKEEAQLTEKGRQYIHDADGPKQILETLLLELRALGEARRATSNLESIHPELTKATTVCVKAIENAAAKMQQAVETAFEKMEQSIVKSVTNSAASVVTPDLSPVLAALQAALSRIDTSRVPAAVDTTGSQPAATSTADTSSRTALRTVLRQAYDDMCLLVDFEDRLVPLPRLYHQAKHLLPTLTVSAFHQELQQLWDERVLELQGINEVRTAAEPDKAIRRGDDLLYFVMWR